MKKKRTMTKWEPKRVEMIPHFISAEMEEQLLKEMAEIFLKMSYQLREKEQEKEVEKGPSKT